MDKIVPLCKICRAECEDRDCEAMLLGLFDKPQQCVNFKLKTLCPMCKKKDVCGGYTEEIADDVYGICCSFRHYKGYWT